MPVVVSASMRLRELLNAYGRNATRIVLIHNVIVGPHEQRQLQTALAIGAPKVLLAKYAIPYLPARLAQMILAEHYGCVTLDEQHDEDAYVYVVDAWRVDVTQ